MTKEELEASIRTVRSIISQHVNTVKAIYCSDAGRELALSVTNFQVSAMWLSKLLGLLGSENPYPESRNPESKVTEKHANTVDTHFALSGDNIADIKLIRSNFKDVSAVVEELREFIYKNKFDNDGLNIAIIHSQKQLTEADMWLGMALGAIRDKAEATK